MTHSSKRQYLLLLLIVSAMMLTSVFACLTTLFTPSAETVQESNLSFTVVTDSDGEQSYSVSIRAAAKPAAQTVIIPDTYNGLPVTQIANNGFMSCANLKRVYLPTTVKKIGNNAFMNCAKLERIGLAAVESIGMNAFAMCPKLDGIYIRNTVKSVGANILRNNSKTVYIQSSEEEVSSTWQSTWSSYFTGDIVFGAQANDVLQYREILDENSENIVGYELSEYQSISDESADIVVYNAFRADENAEYLPVLNICSEAFTFSQFNSFTLKDINADDPAAPVFDHKVNIRSNAFLAFFGNEISLETGVIFDHPDGLQDVFESAYDCIEIVGDEQEHSTRIFAESTIKTITLPSDIEYLPEKTFEHCAYLESIKFIGQDYIGENALNSVKYIGSSAFDSCVSLSNLTIPSTVTQMGECVFFDWGSGEKTQTLNIDFYDGFFPDGWSDNWFAGNQDRTVINYKPLTEIVIDLQDDVGSTITIGVKPGLEMPAIEKPQRKGYTFKGIYSKPDGGLQYYTEDMNVRAPWQYGEPTTIYSCWEIITYNIIYPAELDGVYNPNPDTYTVEDEIILSIPEDDAYYYKLYPNMITKGSVGDQEISCVQEHKRFVISYFLDDLKGCVNTNKEYYEVTDEIVFTKLECEGYTFEWSPAGISNGSTGDLTVRGIWTPNKYNITYKMWSGTDPNNPATYTYNEELVLRNGIYGGYFVVWDRESIPAGTIGDVVVTASYAEKTLDQCKNASDGVYEIWTMKQFEQLRNQPNAGSGRTYRLMKKIQASNYGAYSFIPLTEFRGVFDGNGNSITNCTLDSSYIVSNGNFGFCRINYGTIKNFTLGMNYSVSEKYSNVNAGSFAGTNKGTIENCKINLPGGWFNCDATGDSYAGFFVGVNDGTIKNCSGGNYIYVSCNMGGIAGKNTHYIISCNAGDSNTKIHYRYLNNHNACIGGVVGVQTAGKVENCSFQGHVDWDNLQVGGNNAIQPCGGCIIGYKKGGTVSGNSWKPNSGSKVVVSSTVPPEGNQGLYYKEQECGRED